MPDPTTPEETPDRYRRTDARFSPSVDPIGKVDVACYMTTSGVDEDNEVVLPEGIDLSRFEKNGPLLLCHDWQKQVSYYPLPVGQVLWVKRRPDGLFGGLKFARGSVMGQEVKALVDEEVLRGVSIGFRIIEQSPMTRAEAETRADWKAAFDRTKGRVNVIRRCKLLELSVVPIPCNEDALIETLRVKGLSRPEWLPTPRTNAKEAPVAETETEIDPELIETEDVDGGESPETPDPEAVVKAVADDDGDAADEPDADEDDGPVRKGHFVKATRGAYKGMHGKVKSVHRSGLVPDVDDDVMGSKADPAVRMQCYKAMGSGHVETDHHVACKSSHCEKVDDLKPPKKAAKAAATPTRAKALDVEILPGEVVTDDDLRAARREAARKAASSPDAMKALAAAVVERMQGVV